MFTRKFFGKEFQSKDELIIEALVLATTTATSIAAHQDVYVVDGIHLPTNIIDYKSIFQKIIQNFRNKKDMAKKNTRLKSSGGYNIFTDQKSD